jgi:nucleotide-binding universal stress UspA family protein
VHTTPASDGPSAIGVTDLRLDRILCAVTFSPSSRSVVEWAAALAACCGAELRLFHALNRLRGGEASYDGAPDSEDALNRLFGLARHIPGRLRLSAAVADGDVADEIVRHGRLLQADLIVLGMKAEDGTVSPLASRITADARCPVMLVPQHDLR